MQEWEKMMQDFGVIPGKTITEFCDLIKCGSNQNYHCTREKTEIDCNGFCKHKNSRGITDDEMRQIVEKSQKEPHVLKTVNPYFNDVWAGIKTFEDLAYCDITKVVKKTGIDEERITAMVKAALKKV